ncbi:hypothetical protein ABAC460_05140 [Asticcacaulis sp. AC460]|uniref:hypothetical protein n=1 Tax=Asticcacaulis sp. AC460 TaxID=1282360 RepID=UPI0003C3F5F0|nr:hypothetical protein [Asticcacaulis sp. AC460]ESQ91726.1 hypothetical protein ABAC460_05140 [Asticcacaulis sp. AC460]
MNKLNIDFAFEGFRIVREKPLLIVFWGIVLLVGNALGLGLFFYLAWPGIQSLITSGFPSTEDPMAILNLMGQFVGPYFLLLLIMMIVQAVMACAVYRRVLGRPESSFGYIRFGGDELRMIAVMFVLGLLLGLINFGISLVGGVLSVVASSIIGTEGARLIFDLLTMVIYLYFVIRLSLAYVQCFDEKSFNLFGSWNLTKDVFGTLLGGYVLMVLLGLVVGLLCLVVFWVVAVIGLGGNLDLISQLGKQPSAAEITRILTILAPWLGAYVVFLSLIVSPLVTAIFTGAPAAAYRQVVGASRRRADNVF